MLAGEEDFATFLGRVRGEAISLSEADRRANWRTGMADPGRAVRLPARVLDQGLGGYRVLWEQGAGVRARVGTEFRKSNRCTKRTSLCSDAKSALFT